MAVENRMPAVHPGEVLRDELDELGLSANALAQSLDIPANRVSAILNGQRGVTADTALRLAGYFGTTPELWLNLQKTWELRRAQEQTGSVMPSRAGTTDPGSDTGKTYQEMLMMYDTACAFSDAARIIEADISKSHLYARGGTRRQMETWMAHKTASHFNLHQCLESYIKCVRALERTSIPSIHPLAKLYDGISPRSQAAFEDAYQRTVFATDEHGVVLCFSQSRPKKLEPIKIDCFRDLLAHWDGPLGMWKKRYQWEQVGCGEPMHFLDPLEPYLNMGEQIRRYVARQSG